MNTSTLTRTKPGDRIMLMSVYGGIGIYRRGTTLITFVEGTDLMAEVMPPPPQGVAHNGWLPEAMASLAEQLFWEVSINV